MTTYLLRFLMLITLALVSMQSHALKSVKFLSDDWQLVCDNTLTCRAAGYQKSKGGGLPVSVLLTRKAGPNAPVTGQVVLGTYEDKHLKRAKSAGKLAFMINGKRVGADIDFSQSEKADLSSEQVSVLLAALTKYSKILLVGNALKYEVSDKGAAVALLKMDKFQGRVNTPGALVRQGKKSENTVLPPQPIPVVRAVTPSQTSAEYKQFAMKNKAAIKTALRQSLKANECPNLEDKDDKFDVVRLADSKLLVSAMCSKGKYNSSAAFWVLKTTKPNTISLVTKSGSYFENNHIVANKRGRALSDCGTSDVWTWNGKQFVETSKVTSGLCKLVAFGGAWELPLLVTDIR